jgi:WD40 repeat protein
MHFHRKFPAVLSVDAAGVSEPVVSAAMAGEIIAVVIANSSLKVFDLARGGTELFNAPIDPIPLDFRLYESDENRSVPRYCIAISYDRKMVAVGYDGCYVWQFDSGDTTRLVLAQGVVARITCLAFSDDGKHLVTGFSNGDLHEWVTSSGVEGRQFLWPNDVDDLKRGEVWTAVYARNDGCIISGSQMGADGPVRFYIWSRSGECMFSYLRQQLFPATTFAPTAHWLISCYSDAGNEGWEIQDPLTGKSEFTCTPKPREYSRWTALDAWHWLHLVPLAPVSAISSDGKLGAFGSCLSIFIWDIHENIQLAELVGHSRWLSSVTFAESNDDTRYRLVSTSLDGTIRLWDLDQLFKPRENQHPMTSWGVCAKVDGYIWRAGGWIHDGNGECLFWLPASRPIRHPLNTLVIGQCAELDMTNFVYGEEWTKCRGSNANKQPSETGR